MTDDPTRCPICGAVETVTAAGRSDIWHDPDKHRVGLRQEPPLPTTLTRPRRVGTFGYDEEG